MISSGLSPAVILSLLNPGMDFEANIEDEGEMAPFRVMEKAPYELSAEELATASTNDLSGSAQQHHELAQQQALALEAELKAAIPKFTDIYQKWMPGEGASAQEGAEIVLRNLQPLPDDVEKTQAILKESYE